MEYYTALEQKLLDCILQECFQMAELHSETGVLPSRGLIVSGPTGVGKTHLCRNVFARLKSSDSPYQVEIIEFSALQAVEEFMKDDNSDLDFFKRHMPPAHKRFLCLAAQSSEDEISPSDPDSRKPALVMFIDDLALVGKHDELDASRKNFIKNILNLLEAIPCAIPVALVMTRSDDDAFTLRSPLFFKEFQVAIPNKAAREQVLADLLAALPPSVKLVASGNDDPARPLVAELSSITPGYTPHDLSMLIQTTLVTRFNDCLMSSMDITSEMLRASLSTIVPSTSASAQFTRSVPLVSFDQIGGYQDTMKQLRDAILHPLMHSHAYDRLGVHPPSGVLLYGPTGCGKTLMVHALASSPLVNVISVKGPELMSEYWGESERQIRQIFAQASKNAPCVLFFDMMEAVGGRRELHSDSTTSANDRVLTTLLNEMDGISGRAEVVVIGCTNKPHAIDDALLRPGRLDRLMLVPLPCQSDRSHILKTIGVAFSADVDTAELARATIGCSGADLQALARDAALEALRAEGPDVSSIHWEHVVAAARARNLPVSACPATHNLPDALANLHVDASSGSEEDWICESEPNEPLEDMIRTRIRYLENVMKPYLEFQNKRANQ